MLPSPEQPELYGFVCLYSTLLPQAGRQLEQCGRTSRDSHPSEDQLNSFAAQNRYYTELISSKAEWRMVDIYADEGITGTSVAKRNDFQRMMADCRRGLIDQILVKSMLQE